MLVLALATVPLDPGPTTAHSARCLPVPTDEWVAPTDPVGGVSTGTAFAVGTAGIVAGLASGILVGGAYCGPP